jgi:hypothetical protein
MIDRYRAVKTRQLVSLYYGKAPKFTYYDGHSQGGRQGYKIVQEYPELYDGYMIAAPALSIPMFRNGGSVCSDSHEDRPRIHGREQARGCGFCREATREQDSSSPRWSIGWRREWCPRGDRAHVARQQRKLSCLRLSANDDMERQWTGDAGQQLRLQVTSLLDASPNSG